MKNKIKILFEKLLRKLTTNREEKKIYSKLFPPESIVPGGIRCVCVSNEFDGIEFRARYSKFIRFINFNEFCFVFRFSRNKKMSGRKFFKSNRSQRLEASSSSSSTIRRDVIDDFLLSNDEIEPIELNNKRKSEINIQREQEQPQQQQPQQQQQNDNDDGDADSSGIDDDFEFDHVNIMILLI